LAQRVGKTEAQPFHEIPRFDGPVAEVAYASVWYYGPEGLRSVIDIECGFTAVLFLAWLEDDGVEISSAREALRYSYDAERDVMTVKQSAPHVLRRVLEVQADGTYAFRI